MRDLRRGEREIRLLASGCLARGGRGAWKGGSGNTRTAAALASLLNASRSRAACAALVALGGKACPCCGGSDGKSIALKTGDEGAAGW